MITIVLTNRNRDITIIKNCLNSLKCQTDTRFDLYFVDYGSDKQYVNKLKNVLLEYHFIKAIFCPVDGQLWNKSRAINIALKKATTPYFLVGDVDLIFSPEFVSSALHLANPQLVTYFQYGFLSPEESKLLKLYDEYKIDFKGSDVVTGTSLFYTKALLEINGYDEFYHGWGAEDTDIQIRMEQFGLAVKFYTDSILVKHQWHAKSYRTKNSLQPFHSKLEAINHDYMLMSKQNEITVVNKNKKWGEIEIDKTYEDLFQIPAQFVKTDNSACNISATLAQLNNFKGQTVQLEFYRVNLIFRLKNNIKRLVGKKNILFLPMDTVNDMVLERIITNFHDCPYHYSFDRVKKNIKLFIRP